MPRAATPAIAALVTAGVPHEVLRYHHDPRVESFGDEAVAELAATEGVAADQILKTLIIELSTGLAVAVLPVPAKLSLKAAAAALSAPRAAMADRRAAERSTGYVLGGISPSVSASRCRRSSTPPPWRGTGCCAALASAAGTWPLRPTTSSDSPTPPSPTYGHPDRPLPSPIVLG